MQPALTGGLLFSCGSRPAAAARSLGSAARALVIVFVLALAAGLCLCVRAIEKLLHLRCGAGRGKKKCQICVARLSMLSHASADLALTADAAVKTGVSPDTASASACSVSYGHYTVN